MSSLCTKQREEKRTNLPCPPCARESKRAGECVRLQWERGWGREWPPAAYPPQKGPWHWHSLTALLRRGQIERKWPLVPPFCRGPCEITVALLFLPSFLGQVKEINDEKSLSLTSSFREQEKKRLFPWKGWGGNVEVLTLTIYFCLGKCRVVPKPVHGVHGWQRAAGSSSRSSGWGCVSLSGFVF